MSDQPISLKRIKGAGPVALSWSKNPKYKKSGEKSIVREFWRFPLLILNLKIQQWWKGKPKNSIDKEISWNLEIPKGFYIIDNMKASKWVELSSNNKTNSVVEKQYVYKSLLLAKENDELYMPLPESRDSKEWDLLGGVQDKEKIKGIDMDKILKKLSRFVNDKGWRQFHTVEGLVRDLNIKSEEASDYFVWKDYGNDKKIYEYKKKKVANELVNILNRLLLISQKLEIDLEAAALEKMEKTSENIL